MSTIERSARTATLAPLVEGQRLDQATFHERYEQMPLGTRAELINGVVHMPSPVGPEHALRHGAGARVAQLLPGEYSGC